DTGATVTAAPVTPAKPTKSCTKLAPPVGKTNPTSFNLEPTGPLGLSQVAVPYGTYEVTVTHSSHKTVKLTVGPSSVTETPGSAQSPLAPVVVAVT
ncbi:MAG: hypothetical protein ACRDV8_08390, partial [Acidimicrobiales bacterium]